MAHTYTQEFIIQINTSLPLLFMLNSCDMPEMVFKVSRCIVPASLLNTMPRNPFCIQPGVSSAPTTHSLHPCPVSAFLWVLHPNVWRRSCTFPSSLCWREISWGFISSLGRLEEMVQMFQSQCKRLKDRENLSALLFLFLWTNFSKTFYKFVYLV